MGALINFFKTLGGIITSLVDFVISTINDIVMIVQLTATVIGNLPGYFSWLPSALFSVIATVMGVVVIYKILGREG